MNDNSLRDLPLPTSEDAALVSKYLLEVSEGLRQNPDAILSPVYGPDNLKEAAAMIIQYGHRVKQLRRVIEEQVRDPDLRASLTKALDHG